MKSLKTLMATRKLKARDKKKVKAKALRSSSTEKRLRTISPQMIQNLYNQGIDNYSSGDLKRAQARFEEVLRLDPGYVPASKALKRVKEELTQN